MLCAQCMANNGFGNVITIIRTIYHINFFINVCVFVYYCPFLANPPKKSPTTGAPFYASRMVRRWRRPGLPSLSQSVCSRSNGLCPEPPRDNCQTQQWKKQKPHYVSEDSMKNPPKKYNFIHVIHLSIIHLLLSPSPGLNTEFTWIHSSVNERRSSFRISTPACVVSKSAIIYRESRFVDYNTIIIVINRISNTINFDDYCDRNRARITHSTITSSPLI